MYRSLLEYASEPMTDDVVHAARYVLRTYGTAFWVTGHRVETYTDVEPEDL